MKRRDFIRLGLSTAVAISSLSVFAKAPKRLPIRAVAFDAFPIFDPRPVFALANQLFPDQGDALVSLWRSRQFEYQWLRALSRQYVDFWQATADGLTFAGLKLGLSLSETQHRRLMNAYLQLNAWPDTVAALRQLKEMDLQLCLLSNMTPTMLSTNVKHAGLEPYFDAIISTDQASTYKPDPKAYQLGVDRLGLGREEILFTAFAGWDVAGAKWFGYPTYWVNRAGASMETLGVAADGVGRNLSDLVAYMRTGTT